MNKRDREILMLEDKWKRSATPKKRGCHHAMEPVLIPDPNSRETVTIYCSAGRYRDDIRSDIPDFGLYADSIWSPPRGRNEFVDWPDFGIPRNSETARLQIIDAFIRACEGERVEIGCIGGHGRTGTLLACMVVLAGHKPQDAVRWVRRNYCSHAVETSEQGEWVEWFYRECGFEEVN
jgi:protein-tyrosine phosphatase